MAAKAYKFSNSELSALRFDLTYLHDADSSEFRRINVVV